MTNLAKVLIIESEAIIRFDIYHLLAENGFQVNEANDGINGLQLLETVQPDIVLCESRLPDIDGFEVLRQIRSQPRLMQPRFILMSGVPCSPTYRRALQLLGVNDALSKPVTDQELLEAIALQLNLQN
jgi:CheY-like chemotaxis protein